MLYFSSWKVVLILLVVIGGFAVFDLFPATAVADTATASTKEQAMSDVELPPGSHIVLQVDCNGMKEQPANSEVHPAVEAMRKHFSQVCSTEPAVRDTGADRVRP